MTDEHAVGSAAWSTVEYETDDGDIERATCPDDDCDGDLWSNGEVVCDECGLVKGGSSDSHRRSGGVHGSKTPLHDLDRDERPRYAHSGAVIQLGAFPDLSHSDINWPSDDTDDESDGTDTASVNADSTSAATA